jgi:hypothetical protein
MKFDDVGEDDVLSLFPKPNQIVYVLLFVVFVV